MLVFIIQIIIGTIIWFAIMHFLSKGVTIFATPWAWFISWVVVIGIVIEIGQGIEDFRADKALIKEATRIQGAYSYSDGKVGIRTLTEDGNVVNDNHEGFMATFYDESNTAVSAAYFYPSKKQIVWARDFTEEQEGTYKYSGIIFKKLTIKIDSEKIRFKKKSKKWDYYMDK